MDKAESIKCVMEFLKKGLSNSKLCTELKKIKENLNEKKTSDDENDQSEESEVDEEKEEKKYSLRNSNRSSLAKAESSEEEDSEDEHLEAYLKTLDSKARMKFMKKLASVSTKFEWIEFDHFSYSIDILWKVFFLI